MRDARWDHIGACSTGTRAAFEVEVDGVACGFAVFAVAEAPFIVAAAAVGGGGVACAGGDGVFVDCGVGEEAWEEAAEGGEAGADNSDVDFNAGPDCCGGGERMLGWFEGGVIWREGSSMMRCGYSQAAEFSYVMSSDVCNA